MFTFAEGTYQNTEKFNQTWTLSSLKCDDADLNGQNFKSDFENMVKYKSNTEGREESIEKRLDFQSNLFEKETDISIKEISLE